MKIGFFGLLQLMFIGLKLADVLTWSWFWVFTPTWSVILLIILIISLGFVVKKR